MSLEELNKALRQLRETKITVSGTLFFGQDTGASPAKIIDAAAIDAEFSQQMDASIREIAMSFGVPPSYAISPIRGDFVVDSDTQQVVHDTYMQDAKPVETTALDTMMEAASSLPPMPDPTPLRANLWTLDQIRKAFPEAKSPETAQNWLGVAFGGITIEVDTALPDGVIKQGDIVLCNVKKGKE